MPKKALQFMKKLSGKRLLVLGGSLWKDAIKQFSEESGIVLVSAGLFPAGTDEIADEVYRIDTTDNSLMKSFIEEKKIDGVYLGGSELIISSACRYLSEMGLPCYCTPEQWNLLMNKNNFKRLCLKFGLPIVRTYQKSDIIDYPVVVKPADSCGSSGLTIVNEKTCLSEAICKAKENSNTDNVIIEKFVNNIGYCVFYSFVDGKAIFSGMEAKLPIYYEKQKSYVGGLYYFSDKRVKQFRDSYESNLLNLFSHLGLNAGSLWIEVFYDNGNYYFNEVGFRPGGEVSQYPVNYYTGINQVAQDMYYALTGDNCLISSSSLSEMNTDENYAIYPIHCTAGLIGSIRGIDKLYNLPSICHVFMTKKEGDVVKDSGTFSQIGALVHFLYKNTEDIEHTIQLINKTIEITDKDNHSMIAMKLYEDINGYVSTTYGGGIN